MDAKSNRTIPLPFFVYGTLLPNQPNAHLWQKTGVTTRPATFINGRLYDMGHFPMLVEEGNGVVIGQLIIVPTTAYETVLTQLDALEGFDPQNHTQSAYQRQKRTVQTENGRLHTAWVYIGQAKYVVGRPPIKENDWQTYSAHKQQTMSEWWQNISTVNGLDQLK